MEYMMWAKAVLLCARHLKSVIRNLDITMDTLAVCSRAGPEDAQTLAEHAADLIARKTRIVNLWIIAADMLDSLPADKRRLLGQRFILGIGAEELSRRAGIPLRSLYRRINNALADCADHLRRRGLNGGYFEERYGGERWIVSVFRKYTGKEETILRPRNSAAPGPRRAVPARDGAARA